MFRMWEYPVYCVQERRHPMQLGHKGIDAKVSGTAGVATDFKMVANSVSFNIMSSSIYNDIYRAPIRELSCNALDSHIAAGKANVPFEIHLPTQWEPYFSVKDFGTGLKYVKGGCLECNGTGKLNAITPTDDDTTLESYEPTRGDIKCGTCDGTGDYDACKRLYCTYFSSDKNNSDDMIGGFGLGSKSPFAYTNKRLADGSYKSGGFTVTNVYEGKTYIYDAHVKNGIPAVVLMTVTDTPKESNGVEVQFPVDPNDIWEFENKAGIVFEFFDPQPKMNKSVVILKSNYSVRTDTWGMRNDSNGLRAIMGNVQYTVGNIDISRLTEAQKKMVAMPIDLFFNIGDLRPAVSREALQLDDTTIGNILKRLDIVEEHLMEEVKKNLDLCFSGWEARLKLMELQLQSGVGSLVHDAYSKGLLFGKYTNFTLTGAKPTVNELDYNFINMAEYARTERKRGKSSKINMFEAVDTAKRAQALRDVASGLSKKSEFDVKISVSKNSIFVINDINNYGEKYINYLLQQDETNEYERAIVISKAHKLVQMQRAGDEAADLLESLGNPPFLKVSDLKVKYDPLMKEAKEAKVAQARRKKIQARVLKTYVGYLRYRRWGNRSSGWRKAWDRGEDTLDFIDASTKKFYILVDKFGEATRNHGEHSSARDFVEFANSMRKSKVFAEFTEDTPVFGLRSDSPLLNDSSFVALMPYLQAEIKTLVTPEKEREMSLTVNPFSSEWATLLEYIATHQVLAIDSPIRLFATILNNAQKANRDGHCELLKVATALGVEVHNDTDFNKLWAKVIRHYPILRVCNRNRYHDSNIQENNVLVDYIRYADEQNKKLAVSSDDVQLVAETEEEEETVNA